MDALIADIGGTNARFALIGADGAVSQPLALACAEFPGPAEAAEAYLRKLGSAAQPRRAAFAVASPVTGDRIAMTNHPWSFSIADVERRLALDRLTVVNDFVAVALAIPRLAAGDTVAVGDGQAVPDTPIAVLGPGTGLGVSALIPLGGGWRAIATEGGHVTMPATNDREAALLAWLRSRFGHVSAERVLSGPGLVNLYQAISALAGRQPETAEPGEVVRRGRSGDPLAGEALTLFFGMLGAVAGDIALTYGARGGVVIAGGIVPRLLPALLQSDFRRRFEDKGRFDRYMRTIPVSVVVHPFPAFLGLQGLVTG